MIQLREDILVSVCLPDMPRDAEQIGLTGELAEKLSARFSYWEIVAVSQGCSEVEEDSLLERVPNTRIVRVHQDAGHYRRRLVAASEAIGDGILLCDLAEMSTIDPVAVIEKSHAENAVVICCRGGAQFSDTALTFLGRGAGLSVSMRYMSTMAFSRTCLNRILQRTDRQLALRFPPSDSGITLLRQDVVNGTMPRRRLVDAGRRFDVLQRLMTNSAPRVLTMLSLGGMLAMLGAASYAAYAIASLAVLEEVQSGWFSTSIILSMVTGFLGALALGLGCGLQKILELLTPDPIDDITSERNRIDLFAKVANDLNVEVETDARVESPVSDKVSA